jgi:hypothetical protein
VTNIKSIVLPDLNWASRLGASCPRVGLPGTSVSVAVSRVRGEIPFLALPQQAPAPQEDSVQTQLGQTNIHNYMTGASAVGEGASGPPPYREPV